VEDEEPFCFYKIALKGAHIQERDFRDASAKNASSSRFTSDSLRASSPEGQMHRTVNQQKRGARRGLESRHADGAAFSLPLLCSKSKASLSHDHLLSSGLMNSEQKKILVVDDDPDILEVLQLILEEEGYLTRTATQAQSLDRLLNFQPDLILLDVLLSGSDGRVISKRLKSQETTRHIPIVLMSAHVSAKTTLAQSQADDFIAKPFEVNALLSTVHKYV
jgi:CheY-like chemotaxis protein